MRNIPPTLAATRHKLWRRAQAPQPPAAKNNDKRHPQANADSCQPPEPAASDTTQPGPAATANLAASAAHPPSSSCELTTPAAA